MKKAKLYFTIGIALLTNALSCLVVFFMTYNEKKSLSSAFWALALTFGASGAALIALADSQASEDREKSRRRMASRDHWFHTFEYPECTKPGMRIDDTYIPPVETEE